MKTGEAVVLGIGVLVVGGAIFFAVHSQAKAAAMVANANAAAAAKAAGGSKSPYDAGSIISNLGGLLASAGAAFFSDGATLFNGRVDTSKAVLT
jgi:hypothetical protein